MKYLMMFMIALNVYSYTGWSSYEPENKSRKSITYTFKNTHKDAFHIRKYSDGTWVLQVGSTEKIKSNVEELAIKYHMKPREIQSAIKNEIFGRKVPQGVRQFVSPAGKVSDKKKWEYQDYMNRYGVDPLTGEEVDE